MALENTVALISFVQFGFEFEIFAKHVPIAYVLNISFSSDGSIAIKNIAFFFHTHRGRAVSMLIYASSKPNPLA